MSKRAASRSPKRGAKRSRFTKLVPTVVDAITSAEALPQDLRTLLKLTLPVTLNVNKSERSAWEAEVVDQAGKALATAEKSLKQTHAEALAKQNEVISPKTKQARLSAKKEAESKLAKTKAALEESKEGRKAKEADKQAAQAALKEAQKQASKAESEIGSINSQKAALESVVAGEFEVLKQGTSTGAARNNAIHKVVKVGKAYGLDSTLLETFPMTCKKPADGRSEFESMMFTSLEAGFQGKIKGFQGKINELEPDKEKKVAAIAKAQAALDASEAALTAAGEQVAAATTAVKDATKDLSTAEHSVYQIWSDMKKVCDTQDSAKSDCENFTNVILPAFATLKEKEPEPEPVEEPAAEAAAVPAEAVAAEAAPAEAVASVGSVASLRSVVGSVGSVASSLGSVGSVGSVASVASAS